MLKHQIFGIWIISAFLGPILGAANYAKAGATCDEASFRIIGALEDEENWRKPPGDVGRALKKWITLLDAALKKGAKWVQLPIDGSLRTRALENWELVDREGYGYYLFVLRNLKSLGLTESSLGKFGYDWFHANSFFGVDQKLFQAARARLEDLLEGKMVLLEQLPDNPNEVVAAYQTVFNKIVSSKMAAMECISYPAMHTHDSGSNTCGLYISGSSFAKIPALLRSAFCR